MNAPSPEALAGIRARHPDTPVEKISLASAIYNPSTGVFSVSVCYHELTTVTKGIWLWKREVTEKIHRHYTATISKHRGWEYAGTADVPPVAVVVKLCELSDELQRQQAGLLTPDMFVGGLEDPLVMWDGLTREQFYEGLCALPKFGDELRAYVRRLDASKLNVSRN